MKALTVDDNPMTGIILNDKLATLGLEPLVAQDAATAMALVEEHAPDIVVLDWMMPGTNGLELACAIRKHPKGAAAYIIILSAKDASGNLAMAYELGVNEFVRKPVADGELDARLNAARRFIQMRDCLTEARDQLREKCHEVATLRAQLERVNTAA